jgi:hypothetical protein
MTYALIRPTKSADETAGALIVALERFDALSKIVGEAEVIAEFRGRCI